MKTFMLNFQDLESPEQVQEYLVQSLEFPDYYGGNLDALYDMLTEVTEDIRIVVWMLGCDTRIESYMKRVKAVLRDAEQQNMHITVVFAE